MKPCKKCKHSAVCLVVGFARLVRSLCSERIRREIDVIYDQIFESELDRMGAVEGKVQEISDDLADKVPEGCPENKSLGMTYNAIAQRIEFASVMTRSE